MKETWVQSLGWEDPLEKGMAIHSSILAWRIPWTEEPGRLQSMELPSCTWLNDTHNIYTHTYFFTLLIFLFSHLWCNLPESKNHVSSVAQSCPTHCDPMTIAHQAPLFMEFSRQEHWSRLPFPSPGHLPNPGIEPRSPILQAGSLPSESPGKPPGK